jgi:hypothetical protein
VSSAGHAHFTGLSQALEDRNRLLEPEECRSDRCDPGADRLGLEAVGVCLALGRTLVRPNAQMLLAFDLHSSVQDDPDELWYLLESLDPICSNSSGGSVKSLW